LEKLLDAASSGFQEDFPTSRVIVLCSDGESLSGSLSGAVARARSQGINIVSVGLGTTDGQGVPMEPQSMEMMKRADGSLVVSSLRDAPLREAAEGTDGIYVSGNDDGAVSRIADYLRSRASLEGSRGFRRESMARRSLFLILALIALGLSKAAELDLRRKQQK
jgi:Ca-activated chloride channel family protein